MLRIILICTMLIINSIVANSQCFEEDSSIWLDSWISCQISENPNLEYGETHWIMYDFGHIRNLSRTWIWNMNDPQKLDQGFKDVRIDYSLNGQTWQSGGSFEFAKGTGDAVYSGFSGPDLVGIEARYVLLTAMSNYGHASCAGISEVKFNLLPNRSELPDISNDEDDDEYWDDICIEIGEVVIEETTASEAFIYWEIETDSEEIGFVFEYREGEDGEPIEIELEEPEVFLEELSENSTYQFRIATVCDGEIVYTDMQEFRTSGFDDFECQSVEEVEVLETSNSEAILAWTPQSYAEEYVIQYGIRGRRQRYLYTEEPEVYIDRLRRSRVYQARVGVVCEDEILWSEFVRFRTKANVSNVDSQIASSRSATELLKVYPNPTSDFFNLIYFTPLDDVLQYAILDVSGRAVVQNSRHIDKGMNTITMDVSSLVDGVYVLKGFSSVHGDHFLETIIVSR